MGAPFVWFDLTVADDAKIAGFYQGLFGWETGPGAGSYQDWLLDGGQPWGGNRPDRGGAGWALDSLRCGGQPRCRCEPGG